jgi:hypothetical protein
MQEAAEGAAVPELPGSTVYDACPDPYVNAPPLPEARNAVAAVHFGPEVPSSVFAVRFVGALGGQCADVPTEIVYWASASEVPDDVPEGARTQAVPSVAGEVLTRLDEPVEVTEDRPYFFVAIRLAEEGGKTVCLVGCRRFVGSPWWSLDAPRAPYDWQGPAGYVLAKAYSAPSKGK